MISQLFISIIIDGLMLNSGLVFVFILKSWNLDRMHALMPFTLSKAVANIIGSLCGSLIKKNEPLSVLLWGSILSAIGIGICSLGSDITWIIVFWGLVHGLGYGLTHFHQQEDMTSSNAAKYGPHIGCIILPFILDFLFSLYGVNGPFLVISAVILNIMPLTLIGVFKIKLHVPNIIGILRKRSCHYNVNEKIVPEKSSLQKQKCQKKFSKELIADCLESDVIQNVIKAEGSYNSDNSTRTLRESPTQFSQLCRGDIVKCLDINKPEVISICNKIFPGLQTVSEIVIDVETYEKERQIYEGSISEKSLVDVEKSESDDSEIGGYKENGIMMRLRTLDGNSNEAVGKSVINHDSEKLEDAFASKVENIESPMLKKISEAHENDRGTKETPCISNSKQILPIQFKVNVTECSFESEEDYMRQTLKTYPKTIKNNHYRKHSNSLMTDCYSQLDFTKPNIGKQKDILRKMSKCINRETGNVYSISENLEMKDSNNKAAKKDSLISKCRNSLSYTSQKAKEVLKTLHLIPKSEFLLLTLMHVVYNMSLMTLILIFADFADEMGINATNFKWILFAFGVGGAVGRLCFNHIDTSLIGRPSVVVTILFVLNGVTTVGILWSSSLKWFINFYLILGALGSWIDISFSMLKESYINEEHRNLMSSLCKFISGVSMLCLPCAIGFTRDIFGGYELLIQVISCLSIFCALLCILLPFVKRNCTN